jgi:hypothetical protein
MLPSSLYLRGELLYNGGWDKTANSRPITQLTQPPQANNLFIAKSAAFLEASYPVHPLVNLSMAGMASFDRPITVLMPSINVSVSENMDAMLLSQLYKGTALESATPTPNLLYARLRWSF